jgi:hypothetical protein
MTFAFLNSNIKIFFTERSVLLRPLEHVLFKIKRVSGELDSNTLSKLSENSFSDWDNKADEINNTFE